MNSTNEVTEHCYNSTPTIDSRPDLEGTTYGMIMRNKLAEVMVVAVMMTAATGCAASAPTGSDGSDTMPADAPSAEARGTAKPDVREAACVAEGYVAPGDPNEEWTWYAYATFDYPGVRAEELESAHVLVHYPEYNADRPGGYEVATAVRIFYRDGQLKVECGQGSAKGLTATYDGADSVRVSR